MPALLARAPRLVRLLLFPLLLAFAAVPARAQWMDIYTQPQNQVATVGQSATFSVYASGSGTPSYQWYRRSTSGVQSLIPGATADTYDAAHRPVEFREKYQVVVSSSDGAAPAYSQEALLTVTTDTLPVITAQPAGATVAVGQPATLTVTATGPNLGYAWYKSAGRFVGADSLIPGATGPVLTLTPTSVLDSGDYYAVVSNARGSVQSSTAHLRVNGPPAFTAHPQNATANVSGSVTFVASASTSDGALLLTGYQWFKNGVAQAGATGFSFKIDSVLASDGGAVITVTATNGYGTTTSNAAVLTVNSAPYITAQPQPQNVYTGQSATFSVSVTGKAPFSYQWKKNGTAIAGATAATYTISPVATSHAGNYSVTITNSINFTNSANAALTVNPPVPPAFTQQPQSAEVTAGASATFSVAVSGGPAPTLQWYRNNVAIPGATGTTYTTPGTVLADSGATFKAVATNLAGTATSATATLTVVPAPTPPSFTSQPQGQTVEAGQPATFTVSVTGTAPFSYQWQRNGADIPGATSASYTFNTQQSDSGSTFRVKVTNAATTVTSNSATLTVFTNPPQITTQPAGQTVTAGGTATFTVVATGTAPLAYQWFKNNASISGATSASYTTPALQTSDDNSTFYVQVANAAGGANSSQAVLRVNVVALGPLTWKRNIVYLGTKEVAEISSAGVTVTLVDHLGSPRFVVEPTGNVVEQKFLPFGESLLAQADQARVAKGFTNHEQTDPSGLIYMQARFYAPMYHRFLSPDPARDQHFEQTQSWNIYAYVNNNPIMKFDPTGLSEEYPVPGKKGWTVHYDYSAASGTGGKADKAHAQFKFDGKTTAFRFNKDGVPHPHQEATATFKGEVPSDVVDAAMSTKKWTKFFSRFAEDAAGGSSASGAAAASAKAAGTETSAAAAAAEGGAAKASSSASRGAGIRARGFAGIAIAFVLRDTIKEGPSKAFENFINGLADPFGVVEGITGRKATEAAKPLSEEEIRRMNPLPMM